MNNIKELITLLKAYEKCYGNIDIVYNLKGKKYSLSTKVKDNNGKKELWIE